MPEISQGELTMVHWVMGQQTWMGHVGLGSVPVTH